MYRYAAEQRRTFDHQGRRTRCWLANIADISAAKDSRGLVPHFDAFRNLDVEPAEAPKT